MGPTFLDKNVDLGQQCMYHEENLKIRSRDMRIGGDERVRRALKSAKKMFVVDLEKIQPDEACEKVSRDGETTWYIGPGREAKIDRVCLTQRNLIEDTHHVVILNEAGVKLKEELDKETP